MLKAGLTLAGKEEVLDCPSLSWSIGLAGVVFKDFHEFAPSEMTEDLVCNYTVQRRCPEFPKGFRDYHESSVSADFRGLDLGRRKTWNWSSGKPQRKEDCATVEGKGWNGRGLPNICNHKVVVDLGEHILEGHGLTEDASRTGCAGRAKVQLIQLVPDALAHAWSCEDQDDPSSFTSGRLFPPVESEQQVLPGFVESPAGSQYCSRTSGINRSAQAATRGIFDAYWEFEEGGALADPWEGLFAQNLDLREKQLGTAAAAVKTPADASEVGRLWHRCGRQAVELEQLRSEAQRSSELLERLRRWDHPGGPAPGGAPGPRGTPWEPVGRAATVAEKDRNPWLDPWLEMVWRLWRGIFDGDGAGRALAEISSFCMLLEVCDRTRQRNRGVSRVILKPGQSDPFGTMGGACRFFHPNWFSRYYWGFLASVNLAGFLADQQQQPQHPLQHTAALPQQSAFL
eukprot:Skav230974  [mRNA]  locus=scaffold644:73057:92441:+ [translate_table: standard]